MDQASENQLSGIVWVLHFLRPAFLSSSLQIVMSMSQQRKPQKPRVEPNFARHSPLQPQALCGLVESRLGNTTSENCRAFTIISNGSRTILEQRIANQAAIHRLPLFTFAQLFGRGFKFPKSALQKYQGRATQTNLFQICAGTHTHRPQSGAI
ncbi:Hypothetical_protein [Hexamita inflata]|uniref:Hypothetical_protein n=1 Tax=Hexamita inflata TaxID=28002 RepID=A0AA86NR31_9EUKA|nr:Hypothetical protein HINF_LOCUS11439 [Hexamita inflata]